MIFFGQLIDIAGIYSCDGVCLPNPDISACHVEGLQGQVPQLKLYNELDGFQFCPQIITE